MTENNSENQLSRQVMSKISTGSVVPRSRWFFLSREYGLRFLWFTSVIIGAVAMAVTLSVISYRQASLYEVTHDSFWLFLMDALPYLWMALFIFVVMTATYNLKHTNRGYRHTLLKVVLGSMFCSFVAGTLLHLFGLGFGVDKELGKFVTIYDSQEKLEIKVWQNPKAGLLIGQVKVGEYKENTERTSGLLFVDLSGQRWSLITAELAEQDKDLLSSGEDVRIVGQKIESEPKSFLVCGVLPWVYKEERPMHELYEITKAIKDRLMKHKMHQQSREVVGCANLPIMQRLKVR
jgi:hypothetical protein